MGRSKYSREDRKYISQIITGLKNNEDYVNIFKILMGDEQSEYSSNTNGVMLNLSLLKDSTLDNVMEYIKKVQKRASKNKKHEIKEDDSNISIRSNARSYKLSNYEKNILKHRNIKKIINETEDYEEYSFSPTHKKSSSKKKNLNK